MALEDESDGDDKWEYVEDGPPEIIWQGNEIIVKRNKVKVKRKDPDPVILKEVLISNSLYYLHFPNPSSVLFQQSLTPNNCQNEWDVKISLPMQDPNRPTSNPLPPQSELYADYKNASSLSAQQLLENVAVQTPNFGTEQVNIYKTYYIVLCT